MERTRVNIAVGVFVILGILALGYLSVSLGQVSFLGARGYMVTVDFPSVGGLKSGSTVEIAGVEIGRVESIRLADYQARVTLRVQQGIKLQGRLDRVDQDEGADRREVHPDQPGGSTRSSGRTARSARSKRP
jgi:phospholipid/cholesterol/gamma-HCH transport system substrate-binding protein